MRRPLRLACLAFLPVLAGCASPLQQCLQANAGELYDVRADIARTQGNIERGYAVHRQTVTTTQVGFCGGVGRYYDPVGIYWSGCRYPSSTRVETPVAIDVNAERQKLAALQQRELALRTQYEPAVSACYARFGSG